MLEGHRHFFQLEALVNQSKDDLPIEEVGEWALEKHERLRKYIDITRATRRKYVQGSGGATYIDLFCGSGRARIRETDQIIDGSPLVAFKSAAAGKVPFSEIHIADLDSKHCDAAVQRISSAGGQAFGYVGRAEDTAREIVSRLNPEGLHFAFLDPFNLESLSFEAIRCLARLKRIDFLLHVSSLDLQRNLERYSASETSPLDSFAPGWRSKVNLNEAVRTIRQSLFAYWQSKMQELGFPQSRAELVTGHQNQKLYWLVFLSRSEFANGLWDKIRIISGQRELDGF